MNHPPLEQDPAIYLRDQPSPTSRCHILVEQVGSHDGDHTPMHMLAKVAVRLHQVVDWMARWEGREKLVRRIGGVIAGLALANIGFVVTSWLHAHDARIAAEADAKAAEKIEIEYRRGVNERIEYLEKLVLELRQHAGLHSPISDGRVGSIP